MLHQLIDNLSLSCELNWEAASYKHIVCSGLLAFGLTLMYISNISQKKLLIPSSFLRSWSMMKRICEPVTNADTYQSLNLSTILRYMLFVFQTCSSIKSKAACAMNWFK